MIITVNQLIRGSRFFIIEVSRFKSDFDFLIQLCYYVRLVATILTISHLWDEFKEVYIFLAAVGM